MSRRNTLLGTISVTAAWLCLSAPSFAGQTGPAYVPDLLPSDPVAGECYARVEIPAQYETTTHQVVTREAHTRLQLQQPKLTSRSEQIMIKEPSVRYVVRQPTYRTVTDKIMTRPGYDKLSISPPVFQTQTETIQKSAPRLIWKKGNPGKLRAMGYKIHSTADAGIGGKGYSSTTQYGQIGGERCGPMCEIWCLVEEPGDQITVTRQVLSQAAKIHRTPVPPVYQTIQKQVVADPGGVEKIPVPAEYRTLQIEELVHQGGAAQIDVPAEYGQVQGRRLIAEARYEWRLAVCAPGTGRAIQSGHTTSGTVGSQTLHHGSSHLAGSYGTSSTHTSGYRTSHHGGKTVYSSGPARKIETVTPPEKYKEPPDRTYTGPAYIKSDVKVAGHPVYVRRKP